MSQCIQSPGGSNNSSETEKDAFAYEREAQGYDEQEQEDDPTQTPEMETDLFILKFGILSRFSKNPDNSKIKVLLNAIEVSPEKMLVEST